MKSCLILGFGRSGTSTMGGILYDAGYYMGDELYPARYSNPKGFFENTVINSINENILAPFDYINLKPNAHIFEKKYSPFKPGFGHRWLSHISHKTEIICNNFVLISNIKQETSKKLFAYKDPRFNYTLPIWKQYLPSDSIFICMFREPSVTIRSVIIECKSVDYLKDFYVDKRLIEKLWQNNYRRLLSFYENNEDIRSRLVFVNYNELLSGRRLKYLSELLEVKLSIDFVDVNLNRTICNESVDKSTYELYNELCQIQF